MSEEESVLDKRQEWDFIVAGWPSEVRKADLLLTEMEKELDDMLEVAIQQTVSRCKRYSQEHDYPFTTFPLNKSLIFFNRAVEELAVRDVPVEEKGDFRTVLTERFLKYLDEMFNTMRSDDQRLRLKQVTEPDRFPGDIIGMALIHQSVRYLSKYLAAQKEMKRLDYLAANRGTIIELLNKHVTLLDLGKEIC